jgi:flagellum-specific peptidoglycan hydrolase FlgJ
MIHRFLFFVLFFGSGTLFAQKMTQQQYVEAYARFAMLEMERSGVPAAITLAQGILESESGNSLLAREANNHFGIKCKNEWKGGRIYHDDDELGECFRKYPSVEESYRDHSDFLRYRPYYTGLFSLNPDDYKAWAYGLKKAGYATGSQYPQHLIELIERHNLNQYTLQVIERKNAAQSTIKN